MDIIPTAAILFLVLDPFGNIPIILAVLKKVPGKDFNKIILREMILAFVILSGFLLCGKYILQFLHISNSSIQISGGVVLFIIALKMIFGGSENLFQGSSDDTPFIVPIAVPLFAGPSSIATVIFTSSKFEGNKLNLLTALFLAWLASTLVIFASKGIKEILKDKGILAMERLMGMLLTAIAVEMLIQGLRSFFRAN